VHTSYSFVSLAALCCIVLLGSVLFASATRKLLVWSVQSDRVALLGWLRWLQPGLHVRGASLSLRGDRQQLRSGTRVIVGVNSSSSVLCKMARPLQVVLFCFDCLYLNGEVMMRRPLSERRAALYSSLLPLEGKIQFATAKTSRDLEELQVRPRPCWWTLRLQLRLLKDSVTSHGRRCLGCS
jgi:hypothetical protein